MKKKKLFLRIAIAVLLLGNGAFLSAQVTIGADKVPETFSVLEMVSNQHNGLRLPQMTTEERDEMADVAFKATTESMGLQIFNTDTRCVETWNGSAWISVCAPPPTLEVNPTILVFTAAAGGGGNKTAEVTTNLPTWTVTDAPSWVTWSISGNTLIVSVSEANTGLTPLTGTITITAGPLSATVDVIQMISMAKVATSPTDATLNSFVGAFWKANQTGERIIRITGITAANAGAWTASVGWYGDDGKGQWNPNGGDGIIFSTEASADTNLGWLVGNDNNENVDMNTSADDATYSVSDGRTFASGTVPSGGGTILFRIGLQQKFTAFNADNNPARYAVVVLSFANNTKVQKIYIRQGEGADYLMNNGDAVPNNTVALRNQCAKFSPYNTTYAPLNSQVPYNDGLFTEYPSQAGALFQWANNTSYMRYAFDAYTAGTLGAAWNNYPSTYWTDGSKLSNIYETCPQGFRRPTDGSTSAPDTGPTITLSGMRQSLYLNPQMGETSNTENSVWGYYADGFFDRRQIYAIDGTSKSTVSTEKDIAHIGNLFFNPNTNASLFFPAAGCRNGNDGGLASTGYLGYYWSASSYNPFLSWYMYIGQDIVKQVGGGGSGTGGYRSFGFSVRCVAN